MRMLSTAAAAARLTNYQLFSGKRLLVTLAVFAGPIILVAVTSFFKHLGAPDETYAEMVMGLYAMIIIPFLGVYWGSLLLSDEIEGKTLVYIWTRPAGRAPVFLWKFVFMAFWLAVLIALSLTGVYITAHFSGGVSSIQRDILTIVWDVRALTMGALAYASFGLLLAVLLKKPIVVGLLYVCFIDGFVQVLPGFLKRLSLRHYIFVLSTHSKYDQASGGFWQLLGEGAATEDEALFTLALVTLIFLFLTSLLLGRREFLGDDPARSQ